MTAPLVFVLSGPNLDRLGTREPEVYGSDTLDDVHSAVSREAGALGLLADCRQTNHEGEMIDWLHEAVDSGADVVINPGAWTHYSYAVRDACAIVTTSGRSLVEVHLSNPACAGGFRHTSVVAPRRDRHGGRVRAAVLPAGPARARLRSRVQRTDWVGWHEAYARAGSGLRDRLDAVRAEIARRLDDTAPHPLRVVSACAGDGRDLLGALAERDDADRVTAVLVESDAALVSRAREQARRVSATVEVRQADAARSDVYADAAPADLLLLCGIFGNISDADVRATIEAAPQLCAPGAEVVWTRHRGGASDLTPAIRAWFGDSGFEEVAFVSPEPGGWSVGVHRLVGSPAPLHLGRTWFTFLR